MYIYIYIHIYIYIYILPCSICFWCVFLCFFDNLYLYNTALSVLLCVNRDMYVITQSSHHIITSHLLILIALM